MFYKVILVIEKVFKHLSCTNIYIYVRLDVYMNKTSAQEDNVS